jgi:DNA polymerase-3 subunit gamma/tau
VTDLLSNWFGTPVRLDVSLGETGERTAAARLKEESRQRQSQAAEAINADPFVRELIEGFGATIVPDSIKPLQGDAG